MSEHVDFFLLDEFGESIVGKPVTDGQPGPKVGEIVSSRRLRNGLLEVTARIDDPEFFKKISGANKNAGASMACHVNNQLQRGEDAGDQKDGLVA